MIKVGSSDRETPPGLAGVWFYSMGFELIAGATKSYKDHYGVLNIYILRGVKYLTLDTNTSGLFLASYRLDAWPNPIPAYREVGRQ